MRAKLTRTGDGLSKSMGLAPVVLNHGDEVILAVKARVTHVDTVPHEKGDLHGALDYVYTFEGQTLTFADTPQNRRLIQKMQSAINELHEIDGQESFLPDEDDDEDGEEDEGE
jgi:hypothetical protein